MDLLNQTLDSFSTQISDGGVSLNADIFEANLVNIVLLAGGLFYLVVLYLKVFQSVSRKF